MITIRPPGGMRSVTRLAGLAAVVLAATSASAQTGVVSGTIADAATGRMLPQVRVQIVGNQGAVSASDANGRFVIRNVPVGDFTLRAQQIGYRPETRPVTIRSNDTTRVEFRLSASAVELEQVVVTGTGGAAEKRQVGASIAEVDVTKLAEQVAIPDVGRMLSAKVAGVRSTTVGGGVGTGQASPPGTLPSVQNDRDWLRQAQRIPVIVDLDRADLKHVRGG